MQRNKNRQQQVTSFNKGMAQRSQRRILDEDEEENTSYSSSNGDEDIYNHIAILAKEYGQEYDDDEEEIVPSLTRRKFQKPKNIPEDTPTSETNDPFSEDDYKEESDDQQEIQMKVQTRKALKDSKKFLHTTRKMENKMTISNNQSILSNALSRENNELYEATINQITSKENWILSTSFDKCFEKIRKQVMSDVFQREKSKNRIGDTRKPIMKAQNLKGKSSSRAEKKPVQAINYDDIPIPTVGGKKNFDDIPIRQPRQQPSETKEAKEPPKRKQVEEQVLQKEKSRRQSKQKSINIEPYDASESELNAIESFFGSKRTLKIVGVGSVLVRFQKFWRTNKKYKNSRAVLDLREMWRTTVFEMERAQYEHLDTSEYKRQLKYFASQFCKEMQPQKPYTPGGKKPSAKDKHTFLHRKQQPAFLKNAKKKKSNSKSSTPATPPDTPTQPTPTNISPPSNTFSTPMRSPPTKPREEFDFTPPISQSPRRDAPKPNEESSYTTPKKSNGMRRSISSRVFRLENRPNVENTPLSEQEVTPFKEGTETRLNSNIKQIIQTPQQDQIVNSPRKMTPQNNSPPRNTSLNQPLNNSLNGKQKDLPNSKQSTPTKKTNSNESNQNESVNNLTLSPIMRKPPPPPIEVNLPNNDEENYENSFEDEMEGYSDENYEQNDSFMEDSDFLEEYPLIEEQGQIDQVENNSSLKHNPEEKQKKEFLEKTSDKSITLNNSTIEDESSLNNISAVSNIEKFSQTYREEEDKKKAEALYNRTTGTLTGLLSPRGARHSTEIAHSPPKQEEEKNLKEDRFEKILRVEETNLSTSSKGSNSELPKPPSRKPPQPTLSLEEAMERDRARFEELENLCFSVDESSIIYQFDKDFVYNGLM